MSPFFAQPEMGSVRFRLQTMGRRPLPSAARVRPGAHSARHQDSRNDLTPCRMAWHFVSDGAHAPHSDQTLGPTPTRGWAHAARHLPSLASLCSSQVKGFRPGLVTEERTLNESMRKVLVTRLSGPFFQTLVGKLNAIRPQLKAKFKVELVDYEGPDVLFYREGGFYGPHRDREDGGFTKATRYYGHLRQ